MELVNRVSAFQNYRSSSDVTAERRSQQVKIASQQKASKETQ